MMLIGVLFVTQNFQKTLVGFVQTVGAVCLVAKCEKCHSQMQVAPSKKKYVIKLECPKCGWFTFRPDLGEVKHVGKANERKKVSFNPYQD